MKKQFAQLSKVEREKVEAEYHRMKPEEFDELMSRAKPRSNVVNGSAARSRSKRKNKSTEKKRAA